VLATEESTITLAGVIAETMLHDPIPDCADFHHYRLIPKFRQPCDRFTQSEKPCQSSDIAFEVKAKLVRLL
jgi:hypothetical protein